MEDEEVGISGDQDSLLIVHEQPVSVIALTTEISFRRRADINPPPSQSLGNREINVLCNGTSPLFEEILVQVSLGEATAYSRGRQPTEMK